MINIKKKTIIFFDKSWPYWVILLFVLLVFRDFFLKGLLPIPSDILVGVYYPWLDSKWGYVVGVPVKNFLPSDVISIIYPWRLLGIEMLKSGILPLWDPNSLLGLPLFANFQAALLNPLNILFFIMSSSIAWSIQVILQPLLISISTFIFLRHLGLGKLASLLGALSFAFCGFSVVWMEYNTIDYTLVFFPLILFFIDKILQTRKIFFVFLLSLSIALQIFSGYPQISIFSLLVAGLYFIYRLFFVRKNLIVKVVYCGIGVMSGVLMSAVQLLPGLEALNLSIRLYDSTAIAGSIQFLPIKHVVTLFVPDFFGNPATGNYWSIGTYDNFAFSLPAVTLFFAIMGLVTKSAFTKKYIIFYIFGFLSLLIATNNPFSNYLILDQNLLGLRSSVAVRVLFIFDFAVAVLAAKQFNDLLYKKQFKLLSAVVPVIIFIGILYEILINTEFTNKQIALRNFLIPFSLTVIISVSSIIFIKRHLRIFLGIVFLSLLFSIITLTDKYLTFTPSKIFYPSMDVITSLKENIKFHRFDKERGEIFPANTWSPYGLKAASGQNALLPLTTAKYMGIIKKEKPGQYSRYIDISDAYSPLYDTLDIQYVTVINRNVPLAYPDENGEPFGKFLIPKFKEFKNIKTVRIMENTTNLGLAWFSQNIICGSSENDIFDELTKTTYDPRKLMLIDCPSDKSIISENDNNIGTIKGVIEVLEESPLSTQLEITTPITNFLNISKAFYPGWKATVDGKEEPLVAANLALSAVQVPAGKHLVKLWYQPESFYIGLKISLIALVIWIIILVGNFILLKQGNTRINKL